ncbi:hypothetical protein EMIT0P253_10549 [Pseudomonas sp. IT-P253]|jgi:hypothetical protein
MKSSRFARDDTGLLIEVGQLIEKPFTRYVGCLSSPLGYVGCCEIHLNKKIKERTA